MWKLTARTVLPSAQSDVLDQIVARSSSSRSGPAPPSIADFGMDLRKGSCRPCVECLMQVEIWSDVICPWCYLGKRRFERALADFAHREDVEVVYRSFELDPSATPGTSTPTVELLATKYGMTVQQAEDAQRQMEERAAQDGLTFRMDGLRSGNTRDAHRLLHLAGDRNQQSELVERLHRGYFTEHVSLFDHGSLADLAVEVGLDREEVTAVLTSDAYSDAVDADETTARSLGATGVPFFVIDRRYGISGAQPTETIAQALQRAWAETETRAS